MKVVGRCVGRGETRKGGVGRGREQGRGVSNPTAGVNTGRRPRPAIPAFPGERGWGREEEAKEWWRGVRARATNADASS